MKRWPFWIAALGALVAFSPNIWWNITHALVSYRHTGANASLGADLFHPLRFVEFFASQAAVFGPFLLRRYVLSWQGALRTYRFQGPMEF